MRMNKQSVITMTAILLCFVILLSLGLHFTATPGVKNTVKKFQSLGYTHASANVGNMTAYNFKKDGESIFIVWYENKSMATKAFAAASKLQLNAILRENAVAIGTQNAIDVFKTI